MFEPETVSFSGESGNELHMCFGDLARRRSFFALAFPKLAVLQFESIGLAVERSVLFQTLDYHRGVFDFVPLVERLVATHSAPRALDPF